MWKMFAPLVVLLSPWLARGELPTERVQKAVEKALPGVVRGALHYPEHRACFSCHHQAQPLMTLASARARGFRIDPVQQQAILDFSLQAFVGEDKHQRLRAGMGHRTMVIGYLLATLSAVDYPPDKTTSALVQYMLSREDPAGGWRDSLQRPPAQGSSFTVTAVALIGLNRYGDAEDLKPLESRIQQSRNLALAWLQENEPQNTEDRVFQLRGLVAAGAKKDRLLARRNALAGEQREDGARGQLPGLKGDAHATGSALVALREAGLPVEDTCFVRGVQFLLETQADDGSWFVETRAKPVQKFFDNGDPGGKSQFISFSATNWAALALLQALAPVAKDAR